jgi:hypothetical protein
MTFRAKFANVSTFTPRGFATRLNLGMHQVSPALPKCAHGVYLASLPERMTRCAHYCGLCRPHEQHYGVLRGDSRKMAYALRYQSSPRRERMTANKNERHSNTCPQCGSDYRYTIENSQLVECSECSAQWRPVRRGDSARAEGVAA